ncbi:AMP deaminase, partial [Friedmanniomyces endolithicus]
MKANISSYNNLMTLTPSAGSNERTINLMMFDMAPEVSKIFYQSENGLTGREMTEKAGIHHLCPGAQIDEVAFTP